MEQMTNPRPPSRRAFTLVELLVVLVIFSVVAVLAMPPLQSILTRSSLDRGGQMIGDNILRARQEAVSRNRDVEVRFYRITSGKLQGWCGIQSFRIEQNADGSTLAPIGPIAYLPSGIVIAESETLSPLLAADPTLRGSTNLPAYRDVVFAGFRYRANGSTGTELTTANNYLTVQSVTAPGAPPANYYTLQVNPITGKVTTFRP